MCGIILSADVAINLIQFAHDSTFQIPGLYTPGSSDTQTTTTSWIDPTDTYIQSLGPTANNSAITTVYCEAHTGKGAQDTRIIFIFDMSAIKAPITGAVITLFTNSSNAADVIRINRIRRTGLTTAANWNTYDGTNNWATAGGDDTNSDIYSTNQFDITTAIIATPGTPFYISHASLLAMVQAAKAEDGILRIIIKSTNVTGGDLTTSCYSADALNTAVQPRLELTTTADTSQRVRSDSDGTRSYMRAR